MQAIIMAGGKGTRMRPITSDAIPKALLPLGKKTFLDYIINHLKINGCDNIIICTEYLGDKIKEHIKRNDYGVYVRISQEGRPLGTAGPLFLIKNLLEDEFFIIYGDIFTTISLKKMLWFHKQKNADATLVLHKSDHPQDSTIVKIAKNNRIISFIEKPGEDWKMHGNLTATSMYILKKDILNFIPKGGVVDIAKDIFPAMLKKGKKLFGYITYNYTKDIGTPKRYYEVQKFVEKILI